MNDLRLLPSCSFHLNLVLLISFSVFEWPQWAEGKAREKTKLRLLHTSHHSWAASGALILPPAQSPGCPLNPGPQRNCSRPLSFRTQVRVAPESTDWCSFGFSLYLEILSAPPMASKEVDIREFLRWWNQQRNLVGFSRQRQAGAIKQEPRKRKPGSTYTPIQAEKRQTVGLRN